MQIEVPGEMLLLEVSAWNKLGKLGGASGLPASAEPTQEGPRERQAVLLEGML